MSWRYQPPALSPVTLAGLLAAAGGAAGFGRPRSQIIVEELKRRYQASDALLTDSGTSALVIALRLLAPPGGTVAYPGYACIDLTAAARLAGVRVRLYDLDPNTLSPDLDSVERTLRRGVDALVVAHLYGYPADLAAVGRLAADHGVPIIEDAAQAAGGTFGGSRLGGLADVSVLSFGRGKGTTAGSGGAVIMRSLKHRESLRLQAAQLGKSFRGAHDVVALTAQWLLGRPNLYLLPASIPALKLGEMVYHPALEPRSISTAAEAALHIALELDYRELAHRRQLAAEMVGLLRETRGRLAPVRPVPGGESGYLRFAFLDTAGDMMPHRALGVVRGYPLTLDEHQQLRPILAAGERAESGAVRLRDRLFTAPTHSRVTAADIGRFRKWLEHSHVAAPLGVFAT